ncbi:uncharacterized protein EI90DRAFT_861270 [Cantharellus anzutake]|uniref:uncharacterized protein n=1 Tax=Cantharellus anzutake TaxID=1750568 RepID=UPI0019068530|nr:uncharacterized protein EI90DRAFT_861270 [Cantharellus anzutake]KAF8311934.1 hypothetical protein EI90DRAFT_861270 [Cantharellus anzutake]
MRKGLQTSSPSREGSDSSPLFDDIPIKWKGLTLDQAKWTFTSKELQSLVAQAIVQSTAVTSIRLLSEEVLEKELPVELERLEDLRDSIKSRLQYQIRRRNVILRSLPLHVDGPDVKTARRLMSDLTKVSHWFEKLTSELYTVMDQIAQIRQLRDNHLASALMMGLQKMNGAFLRVSSENELLSQTLIDVEAERDEGWGKALEVERELDEMRGKLAVPQSGDSAIDCGPSSGHRSRVSAARKTSSRASKASLRTNHPLRSARPSHSGMKFGSLTFPYPPSSMAFDSVDTSAPPVPDLLSPTRQSMDRHDSMTSRLTSTPSVTRAMFLAQHEVLELLGLSTADLDDLGRHDKGKTRSWSASQLTDLPLTTSSRRSSAHLPYSPRYF